MMTTKHVKRSKAWHVTLWIAQILLAGMFLAAGFMKTATPMAQLSETTPMATEVPFLIRFIGVAELAGGLGLLLPAALRILPQLTAFAAVGLAVVMVLAMIVHLVRGEAAALPTNIVLGGLAAFVAWGRFYKAPIVRRAADSHSAVRT